EASALIDAVFKDVGMAARTETLPRAGGALAQHTGSYHRSEEPPAPAPDPRPDPLTIRTRGRADTATSEQAPGAAPLPQVPGNEAIDPLARGGMGVVYKARHLKLNRLVALKMIRPGRDLALDATRREYFFAEARAVAQFQHPNLVQIYEIGELDGQPYFSLELLDGGTLSRKLGGT